MVRLLGNRAFALLAFFAAAVFLLPQYSRAADLTISPATANVAAGKTVTVQVMLDPSGDSVNAADGSLTFDKSVVSVESISRDNSAFSLWTADPSFSNSAGTITFSGGTPTAFTSSKKVLSIVFKGLSAGTAKIVFSKGSVLAADGKGTDVYKNGNGGTITVGAAAAAPPPAAVETSADTGDAGSGDGVPPVAPIINSSTHAKPESWYSTSTAIFLWLLPSDITGVRTLLSEKETDTPTVAVKGGATTTQTVSGIKDGISYYLVQFKNSAGWGDVGKIKVQVDTVPPLDFSVALLAPGSDGGPAKLSFKTDDALSGMDRYEVILGTSTPIVVRAQDITDGSYPVPPQGGGMTHVTIKAHDKAGNTKETSADLTLPAVAKIKPASATPDAPVAVNNNGFGLMGAIFCILLALAVGGLFVLNRNIKKTVKREKDELLASVSEVRDKNDRIFSAMREEFEQLINNFNPQPQLTPEERVLLEEIKEVLDISEELVDTSIEELKKMVRNQQ